MSGNRTTDRLIERAARSLQGCAGGKLIVAVSGGSDSVALLLLVNQLKQRLALEPEVGHFDHGTRGEQSAADARFVAELSSQLAVPFWLERWAPGSGAGFEARARQARYAWLGRLALERNAGAVLVAHTRDDQAETLFHRLVRGTGPRGLCGIPVRRELTPGVTLGRPLLWASRETLRTFLTEQGQGWREDATNLDLSRTRARIRHVLLPELAASYNPRVIEAIARLAQLQRAERGVLEAQVASLLKRCLLEPPAADQVRLDLARLRKASLNRRVLILRAVWQAQAWPEQGMSARHWIQLARLVDRPHSALVCPAGIEARFLETQLLLQRPAPGRTVPSPVQAVFLPVPGRVDFGAGQFQAELDPVDLDDWDERIDADRLTLIPGPDGANGGLMVRPPHVGDRFDPLGVEVGSMALADFFRGRKIARQARPAVPIVCDAGGIVWVAGQRISQRARCTPVTRRRLGLRWSPRKLEPPS